MPGKPEAAAVQAAEELKSGTRTEGQTN
jgi:hypothetical protein